MRPRPSLPADQLSLRDLSFAAIRRWRLVLVGSAALLVLGALAWLFIPRLEEPQIEVPGMTVALVYPGASPEDVEVQVLKPIEEVLFELSDVEWIESRAVPGLAT